MPRQKPKPPEVKRVTGNPGRRPIPEVTRPDTGSANRPAYLDSRPRSVELWTEYAPALVILGTLRKESASLFGMWCMLTAQFEANPDEFGAAKIANVRALASMLGMDPSAIGKFSTPTNGNKDPAAEFFTGPTLAR